MDWYFLRKMKLLIIVIFLINTTFNLALSECVDERTVLGSSIEQLQTQFHVYVEQENSIFKDAGQTKIIPTQRYQVHLTPIRISTLGDYNSKYIEYYSYARIQQFLKQKKQKLTEAGLNIRTIGKSIKGRDLYAVTPKVLKNKKTILMFGRHHGDEGTANWIIEGFLNEYLNNKKFRAEFQLVLYPMVNPDGAEAKVRYNANGRDLNRSWHQDPSGDYDEIKTIHGDLRRIMKVIGSDIFIALDMHGSFTEDFIYRVKKNYVSRDFYNQQQNFIDELSMFDPWQYGNYKLSNGDPRMARLVLVDHYKKNAMTHESIRDIKLRNRAGRTKQTLKEQGEAVLKSIENLY